MLIDNSKDRYPNSGLNIKTVWDFINMYSGKQSGHTGKLDIVTGYFTIRALSKLYRDIPEEDTFRIVSSEMVRQDEQEDHVIDLLNEDLSIDNTLQLDAYANDAKAFLQRNSVQIKSIQNAFCHAKAYMFKDKNPRNNGFYLTGSSNLTDAGLGLKTTSNVELTIGEAVNSANPDYMEVCSWFEDIWKDAKEKIQNPDDPKGALISAKEFFIKKIEEYFRKYTPEEIYYKILYELFKADLELDDSAIENKQDMSLLQTSAIWNTLFNYQQKGVISLIKMINKYNGAILADAVGLGKTFSALAVLKFYQIQGFTTIVLCPKKLEHNWIQYQRGTNSRFERDKFDYQVRFHTDLQDDRLNKSYKNYKLDFLQSCDKLLIVIDESHNLRNEHSGRYQELMEQLIQNNESHQQRQVKVLMLSATPINTGLNDVKGQFNLIGHGEDDAFNNSDFGIESLKNLFRDSQTKYSQWCDNPNRTIGGFIQMLQPKFFNLTDKLIVARTRKLIEHTLGEELGFPDKAKPENIYQSLNHFGKFKSTDEIYNAFEALSLTAYQPSLFLPESRKEARKEAEKEWDDNVNRERFLVKMMGILFMKRLESSWFSCLATVKKVLEVHEQTLQKVEDFIEKRNSGSIDIDIPDEDENFDTDDQFTLRKGTISLKEMKNIGGFKRGLQEDINKLKAIYNGLWEFEKGYRAGKEEDKKLEELIKILHEKQNAPNKKVVIFTAYADTAKFLYDELVARGFSKVASVSGQEIHSTGHHSQKDFNEVLRSFAPYSKLYKELEWDSLYNNANLDSSLYDETKSKWNVPFDKWQELVKNKKDSYERLLNDPIDILIATDCLSEGQNLQDADLQINYDIHWNPVRLIQRFGRIDRIGSPNKLANIPVKCVNFWPAKDYDEYLNLEDKIMNRMAIGAVAGVEDLELNEGYKKIVEDNPLQDRNADRLLEELQHNSISDIESPRTLSFKDFSFEVYRQDLLDYFDRHKETFRKMPRGIFSGFKKEDTLFERVPESLVALVGYPHHDKDNDEKYTELYLMCQPVDSEKPAEIEELNKAKVLEFLRKHKKQERFVPEWIETANPERIEKLKTTLQEWMKNQAPQQAIAERKDRFHSKGTANKKNASDISLDKKFQMENFDLIVWEYVSK